MRFCMITTFYPPYNFGGDGIFVHRLSNELARQGHRVDVIHCTDSYRLLGGPPPMHGYEDHPNVRVHGLSSRYGFLAPLITQQIGYPLLNAPKIRQILEQDFDVIHYHNVSLVGGPGILGYGQGIKLYTTHEYWLVCPTHVLFKFNRVACTQRQCFRCILSYGRPPQWWRHSGILRTAIRQVDTFIAPSLFCKDKHREFGFDAPFVCLPHFVPQPEPAPPAGNGTGIGVADRPYFLFLGRLEKLKGLHTLIPVFRNHRWARLMIAGAGHDEARLKALAGNAENIRFLGYLSGGQLRALIRRASAMIVPSICYDVSSLVTMEAFREGTPVIARNIGGIPELIRESGGGFTYDTDEELVAAMDALSADSWRHELGQRGYQAYRQKWTPEAHLQRYLELIDGLRASRGQAEAYR